MNPCKVTIAMLLLLAASPLLIGAQTKSVSPENPTSRSWLILPGGVTGGAINAQATEAELTKLYGKENVVSLDIELGEGETEQGTALFPDNPERRLEVLWKDREAKRGLKRVQISGEKSLWKTVHGISLGTTLKQLEQLNRKHFLLAGFAWDYSGTVMSWSQGTLEQELGPPPHVTLRLTPPNDPANDKLETEVLGDRSFSSGHPAMQELNPRVYQIIWVFP